jgi:hypothetical protein
MLKFVYFLGWSNDHAEYLEKKLQMTLERSKEKNEKGLEFMPGDTECPAVNDQPA